MQVWKYASSGRKFFKLRITHPIGARELSAILCYKYREGDSDGIEALPDYSRTAILNIVRAQLAMNADAPNWWMDDIEQEWITEVRQWADDLVRHRFPELC